MEKSILPEHMEIMRRGRNVANHMVSAANDIPWAVTYSTSLCAILKEIEKKIHYRKTIVSFSNKAHQYLMQEKGIPAFFSTMGQAIAHALVDDESATTHALSIIDMRPWQKQVKQPYVQTDEKIFKPKDADNLSSKKSKRRWHQ